MTKITAKELEAAAEVAGLKIQHDCGGYRIVETEENSCHYVFPQGGVCPTESKRACLGFLKGVIYQQRKAKNEEPKELT